MQNLGVRPGAVTPLAMINGAEAGGRIFIDAAVKDADKIYMHPLVNDRTLAMDVSDLWVFFEKIGVTPEMLSMA
jgi:Ala-tRNA(Pro) deacylase